MQKLMPLCHTRMKTFGDFMQLCDFFFLNHLVYTDELLCPNQLTKEKSASLLQTMIWSMDAQENWKRPGIEKASHEVSEKFDIHHKKMIIPLLYGAITGKRHGLPLFDSVEILGKDRVRARLLNAIQYLGGLSKKKSDLLRKAWYTKDYRSL
jgi:glutamyl-tRNA synthetase